MMVLTEIEEIEGPSHGSRYFTNNIEAKSLQDEEENISFTESITDGYNSSIDRFNIFNIAINKNYLTEPSGRVQPRMPVIKNVSLQKVKVKKNRISPVHERLYNSNLESRDFLSKILPERKKSATFAPKLSTHSNNLSIAGQPNVVEFVASSNDKSTRAPFKPFNTVGMKNKTPTKTRLMERRERLYAMLLDPKCTF
jgi:hypothetical protein